MVMQSSFPGVYQFQAGRKTLLLTRNLAPGKKVYGEKLFKDKNKEGIVEYREWIPTRSKLAAGMLKGIRGFSLQPGSAVLYLGAATGTTVSHISDIVGRQGIIFAVDFAPRVVRELVFLSEQRQNIAPILGNCLHPEEYLDRFCQCNFLFQDIAQREQVAIFLKHLPFLATGSLALLSIKARSIDVTQKPRVIFARVFEELKKHVTVLDWKTLEPFEDDHALFVCRKR